MKNSQSTSKLAVVLLLIPIIACKTKGGQRSASDLQTSSGHCLPEGTGDGQVPSRDMLVQKAKLTQEEISSINKYTEDTQNASAYREILSCSKKEFDEYCLFLPGWVENAKLFESGIKKISESAPFVGKVFRGMIVPTRKIDEIRGLVGKKAGLAPEGQKAYTSSSRSRDFAKNWSETLLKDKYEKTLGDKPEPHTKVLYVIKQCRGAAIESIEPKFRGEAQKEVILAPSLFEYKSAALDAGMLTLQLAEIGCQGLKLTSDEDSDDLFENEVLPFLDLSHENTSDGLALTQACGAPSKVDQAAKERGKKITTDLIEAVKDVRKAELNAIAAPRNQVSQAIDVVRQKQRIAKNLASSFKTTMNVMSFSAGKIIPVAGAAAEVAGFALGMVEAAEIRNKSLAEANKALQAGDEARADAILNQGEKEANAAILNGQYIAGGITAVIACENCTPDEKAAAFFSGFLGQDFTHLVVCPGKRCPHDQDLVQGYISEDGSRDWSLKRIKRSCPDGYPIVATAHSETQIAVSCGTKNLAPQGISHYRFVENGYQEKRWTYELKCGEGEYLAGISFGVTTHYGIKSVLCANPPHGKSILGGQCQKLQDSEACPNHLFMRGIEVSRAYRNKGLMGVFVDRTNRDDDRSEYGDHVKSVFCCNY